MYVREKRKCIRDIMRCVLGFQGDNAMYSGEIMTIIPVRKGDVHKSTFSLIIDEITLMNYTVSLFTSWATITAVRSLHWLITNVG